MRHRLTAALVDLAADLAKRAVVAADREHGISISGKTVRRRASDPGRSSCDDGCRHKAKSLAWVPPVAVTLIDRKHGLERSLMFEARQSGSLADVYSPD